MSATEHEKTLRTSALWELSEHKQVPHKTIWLLRLKACTYPCGEYCAEKKTTSNGAVVRC